MREGYSSGRIKSYWKGKSRPDISKRMKDYGARKAKIAIASKTTKIEMFVKNILLDLGLKENIDFMHDKPIQTKHSFRFPDFRLINRNIIIECDGSYWHKNKAKDNLRDKELQGVGYSIHHFTEDFIKNNPMELKEQIRSLAVVTP